MDKTAVEFYWGVHRIYFKLLELEKLNTATAEINRLELELDESNTTFRMLLNEATRRLKGLAARLGSSVEKARPYHEAALAAHNARAACQRAAIHYQRASEIHTAAKETVALAEQRFKSKQHEWQFDNAWQEMLNHATIKVMDAENQKAESGREHQKKAQLFNTAETKLQHMEEQLRKHIAKSRPYFEEKQLCQEQLATQKTRIEQLQREVVGAKERYARSLRALEGISEDIHRKRRALYGDSEGCPVGPREPGVGAEKDITDYSLELESHDLEVRRDECSTPEEESGGLEELQRRVRRLAARPLETGASRGDSSWEDELNSTVQRLDQMLLAREKRMLSASQSARSSRDHLSPSSLPPSQASHPDEAQSATRSDEKLTEPFNPTHSHKPEMFYSTPDISSTPCTASQKDNSAPVSSPHSLCDNSSSDSQLIGTDANSSEMTKEQLCLSVLNLEELLPRAPKDSPRNIKSVAEHSASQETVCVPFTYKIVDDFNLNRNKTNSEQNKENLNSPDDPVRESAATGQDQTTDQLQQSPDTTDSVILEDGDLTQAQDRAPDGQALEL